MAEDTVQLYKYTIPLEDGDGADKPAYEPDYSGQVVERRFGASNLIVVKDESIPHFHKDSVNVSVEEVDAEGYDYEPAEDQEPEETEDEGEE